jgi:putative peptidoglycan lipid II flippase
LAASTIYVIAATLASTILGFGREIVNAGFFGTRWELDTFLAAATIPTILFGVFNGALVNALLPVFSEYLTLGDREGAYRLSSTVFNILLIGLSMLVVLGWIGAPMYVPMIAHGFPAPQMGVAIRMTRLLLPSIVATSLAGVVSAVLNAEQRFTASALQGVAVNIVTMATVFLLYARFGIYALVFGTTLGFFAQLAVQLPSLIIRRSYRFVLDLAHPGLNRVWSMLGPVVVGSAAGQIALFFDRFFASTLSPGYIAGMNYATKLVGFPQQVFAAAIATVIFPLLASQFAASNRSGIRRSVSMGLRLVNLIAIPSVCGLTVLSYPIVQTLFERGAFDERATALCASLLPFAAIGLVALAANVVLTRCCFACKETRLTVVISVGTVVLNVALSLLWLKPLGAAGLLLANSVSQSVQMVFLLVLVWRLVQGMDARALFASAWRIALASLVMVASLHWINALGVHPEETLVSRTWYLFGQLAIGALVFIAVARGLGVEEIDVTKRLLLEKFERRIISPPENREGPIA